MSYKPWHLMALEENGYTDTSQGLCNKVADYLAKYGNNNINTLEFRSACIASNVDPDSITQTDLNRIQKRLNKIT